MRLFGRKILFILTLVFYSVRLWANDNAVILLYHHVSESTPAVTSVSADTFRQHMQYLSEHHNVLPLKTVVEKLKNKQPLPNKTVVITFDDGYNNLYHQAHPILKEFGFAYTVFINPPLIGQASYQLTWQQVEQMASENATFANHASEHLHLLTKESTESEQDWLARVTENIESAEKMLQKKLGYSLKYFAYPYGEFNSTLKQHLTNLGYTSFAQHSGAIGPHSDFAALPRFPAAGIYSKLESLKVKLNSLAMPVSNPKPSEPEVLLSEAPEQISFEVNSKDINLKQISCFQYGQSLEIQILENQVTAAIQEIKKPGRKRINCTAPSIQQKGRYYWYSHPMFIPTANGKWLD
ncbi:polysaccharide deacetylase family protein [Paraglaciecola aestuariivivens]